MQRHRPAAKVVLVAAGLACLLLAIAGAVVNLSSGGSAAGDNMALGEGGPIDAANSPTVVRNPRRPKNLVVTYRVDRPGFSASLRWSADGGRTWRKTPIPLPEGKQTAYAPDAAFGPDGRLQVLYSDLVGVQNAPENLWLSTSDDGGRTLSPPTLVASGLTFQPRLAVSPQGTVYVTWLQAYGTGILRFVDANPVVFAARSDDGGKSFSTPVAVSDASRVRVGAATPVVDDEGRLVVLYEDFKNDRRDFEYLEGPPYEDTFALVLTTSSDRGQTFAPGVEIESGVVPTRRFLVYLPEFPSLAAGPDHALYVSWADGRNGDEDVFVRGSGDNGRSWTDAVRVNDNRLHDGTTQTLPRVAVAPQGQVDVAYYDRRRDHRDVKSDVTLARSVDGGQTWSNTRVSGTSFDSRVGPSADPRFGTDFGTRLGLAAGPKGDEAVVAWADSRHGDDATGRQDVFVAEVGGQERVPLVGRWLVVAGFVVLGGALLLVASRRPAPDRSSGESGRRSL